MIFCWTNVYPLCQFISDKNLDRQQLRSYKLLETLEELIKQIWDKVGPKNLKPNNLREIKPNNFIYLESCDSVINPLSANITN